MCMTSFTKIFRKRQKEPCKRVVTLEKEIRQLKMELEHLEKEIRQSKTEIVNLESELKVLKNDQSGKDEIFSKTLNTNPGNLPTTYATRSGTSSPENNGETAEFSCRNGQKLDTEVTSDPGMSMPVQETQGESSSEVSVTNMFTGPLSTLSHRPNERSTSTQHTTDVTFQRDNEHQSNAVAECSTASQANFPAKGHPGLDHETESNKDFTNAVNDKNMSSNFFNNQPSMTSRSPYLQGDFGCNGYKLSKHQRPNLTGSGNCGPQVSKDGQDNDDAWLCRHYKRRCFVRFSCCDKYWPCHRCHNNESKCGQRRLKSRDTKFVQCVSCKAEHSFDKESKSCRNCHKTFAEFFCATCKHLTGMDDKPYHCQKCGICRIHSDRSFHCDVCGICLDIQLRDNHKCRAGSAHDECCICLQDAFSGCQILPCSHKVHKDCATQMIRSGITSCPVCRESFAHKLERKSSLPSSRK